MQINNIGLSSKINPYNKNNNNINRQQKSTVNQADKIEISTTAQEMQQISQNPLERNEKIASLKAQVENGTYEINPEKTAKSIINYFFGN